VRRALVLAAIGLTALLPARVSEAARADVPGVQRPNPALSGFQLDYESPLPAPGGGVASLRPLDPHATAASVHDLRFLAYRDVDDLGGFVPAPVGGRALVGLGRTLVGRFGRAQIPLMRVQAGGAVASFGLTGQPPAGGKPDNGRQPVPGIGVPVPAPQPSGERLPPPANQGFGGRPGNGGGNGGGGTTTAPTTTETTTTTAATTTTTAPPASTTGDTGTTPGGGGGGGRGGGGGGGGGGPGNCGTTGLKITSDLAGCRIVAVDMRPGDATTERLSVTNESGGPFTLALQATGTQNHLWQDLRMAVYHDGDPPPSPLPPLVYWTTQYNDLDVLAPGETVTYVVELYLPTSAGNVDQGLAAVIDFDWQATG
jgi:hypothetical protein